jgi:hypothetical protein
MQINKAAHTPGPWRAGRDDMATLVEGYESKWIYAGHAEPDYHKYIALASGMEIEDWSEVMANARLISAAPEMLEVLEEVVAHAYTIEDDASVCLMCSCRTAIGYGHLHNDDCLINKAEAAIQKARGVE